MRVVSFMFVLFLFSFSCKEKEKKPDYIISEPKFVRILIDYNLAQGVNTSSLYRKKVQRFKEVSLIDSIFIRHGVSRAQFDSSFLYYSRDPQHLDAIFDQVMNEFSRRSAEIRAKTELKKKADEVSKTAK